MKTFFFLLLFISGSVFSQSIDDLKKSALKDAQALSEASINQDTKTILTYTHPKISKKYSKKKLTEIMEDIFKTMEAQKIKIVSSEINEIAEIKNENNEYRCLAKNTIKMDFNGKLITLKSSLFGFYNDKKAQWYFVESSKLLEDPETKELFVNFKTAIEIPQDEKVANN